MSDRPLLQVNGLRFTYPRAGIFQNLSLTVRAGEIASLIGLSGAGKSTLFKLLTGVLSASAGEIFIAGERVPGVQQQVAYLMQEDLLLPWRSVLSNVTLVGELGTANFSQRQLNDKARERLEEVGLKGKEEAFPHELSGGQRQRVALARALLLEKPLLLLDEPFSSLDLICREQLYLLLRDVQRRHGVTILMATHDFRDALCLSDRILLLDGGCITQEWVIDEQTRQETTVFSEVHQRLRDALVIGRRDSCAMG